MALSDLNIKIKANLDDFSSAMQNADRKLKKFQKNMTQTGKSLTMALTAPIVALGAKSVMAFDKQEQAEQKLAAQIRQAGLDVQTTLPYYTEFASKLQNITTVGDEVTLGLIQMAMTMGSTAPETAAQNAIALSKALGVDLNSAIKMVTLAESGQYTMLNRYVPALRNAKTETEKAAITNKLYADGLEIAKTEARNGLGPLKQMGNLLGDLSEQFGGAIVQSTAFKDLIEKLTTGITNLITKFKNLSEDQKENILKWAAIIAAVGPVILMAGKLVAAIRMVSSAFMFLAANPIGMVIVAVGLLAIAVYKIIKNWDKIKAFFTKLWLNLKVIFLKGVKALLAPLMFVFEKLGLEFKAFNSLDDKIAKSEKQLADFKKGQIDLTEETTEASKAVQEQTVKIKTLGTTAERTQKKLEKLSKAEMPGFNNEIIRSTIKDQTGASYAFDDLKELDVTGLNKIADASSEAKLKVMDLHSSIANLGETLIDVGKIIKDSLVNAIIDFGETLGRVFAGDASLKDLGRGLLASFADFAKQFGSMLIAHGVALMAFNASIKFGNPFIAIGAGLALLASAGAITGYLNKSADNIGSSSSYGSNYGSFGSSGSGMNGSLSGKLRGEDIYLSSNNYQSANSRIRATTGGIV